MGTSLEKQRATSAIKRQIADNKHATKVLNYQNTNLKSSTDRKQGWQVPGPAARDLSTRDRQKAMTMARQKVEENPITQALVNARLDNIVGCGHRLRMLSGDDAWDTEVEDWWLLERDRLDIRGIRPWGELTRMWQARHEIDGDVGIALLGQKFKDRPLSYVQTWEADHITMGTNKPDDTGITFDEFGMPVKYFVKTDPKNAKEKAKSYPRENFILYLCDNTYRAHRARGVTLFLQTFNYLEDHEETMNGIIQKVKNESFQGIKYTMKGENPLGLDDPADGSTDYRKVKMQAGLNLMLGEGEDAEVLEGKTPHANFDEHEKKLISRIALPFGFTYELLTGDYSKLNDRTARVMLKQFEKRMRHDQKKLSMIESRVFRWALSRAIKGKVLTPPEELKRWFNHKWGYPGFPYINVKQAAEANAINLSNNLTSEVKILSEEGDEEFNELMEDRKYAREVMDDNGIVDGDSA